MGSLQEKMKTMTSMTVDANEPFLIDVMFRGVIIGTIKFDITGVSTDFKGMSGTNIEFKSRLVER